MDADRSRFHMMRSGFISIQDLADVISSGIYLNLFITRQSVRITHDIYEKDIASFKRKTRHVTTRLTRPPVRVNRDLQSIHSDLMYIDGIAFLVSVTTPLHLITATHLTCESPKRKSIVLKVFQCCSWI